MADDFRDADDSNAIRGVILAQIEAFLADDADLAFSFATPAIQEMFYTPQAFLEMVRQHYGPVHRPHDLRFGPLQRAGGSRAFQEVRLTDQVYGPVVARYEMVPCEDGGWRVNGCVLSRG